MNTYDEQNQSPVHVEHDGAVCIVSMARPNRRNAMDRKLIDGLKHAFLQADADSDVGAIVLRGAQHGFCAGSDLTFISNLSVPEMARFEQETGDMARLIGLIATPVVASVENFAVGGGFILAACCDVVVAGESSRWSLPEVPHGWLTPWGLSALVERVGKVKARNLCFCLQPTDGLQAQQIGLVDIAVPDGQADARAIDVARQIAALPRAAVASTKQFFADSIMRDAEVMDVAANRLFAANCMQPEAVRTLAKHRRST